LALATDWDTYHSQALPAERTAWLINELGFAAINSPADWTPTNLTCLKTESFTFTGNHDLAQSSYSMSVSAAKGFANTHRSHLAGISDAWTAWMKEIDIAQS
jgi:hypothetical protein